MKNKSEEITFSTEFDTPDIKIESDNKVLNTNDRTIILSELPQINKFGSTDNRQFKIVSTCSLCKYSLFPIKKNPGQGFCSLQTKKKFKEQKATLSFPVSKKNFHTVKKYALQNLVRIVRFASCENFVFDPKKIKYSKNCKRIW
jgi:hypothetical protein